jgi:ribosomal 50S subunit-recycling heat shock protein
LRVDLYLKLIGIVKTRMAGKRLCDMGKILLEGKTLKPSHELQAGEILGIFLPFREMRIQVLALPETKSVAKHQRTQFFTLLSQKDM